MLKAQLKFIEEDRKCKIISPSKYTEDEKYLLEIIKEHNSEASIKLNLAVVNSYSRSTAYEVVSDSHCIIYDRAQFELFGNIISNINLSSFQQSVSRFQEWLEVYLLEQVIYRNSYIADIEDQEDFMYDLLHHHLGQYGWRYMKQIKLHIISTDTRTTAKLRCIENFVRLFSYYHEFGHFSLSKVLNKSAKNYFEDATKRIQLYYQEEPYSLGDFTHEEFNGMINKTLSNRIKKEEIHCDLYALDQITESCEKDFFLWACLYFSTLVQYKMMATLSNIKKIPEYNARDKNNLLENRVRVDFRGKYIWSALCHKFSEKKAKEFRKYYNDEFGSLMKRYDAISSTVEERLLSDTFKRNIRRPEPSEISDLKGDSEHLLSVIGWL